VQSIPPLNYVGRIVISHTDDTEKKVIANYGGKSWRRIENFLRGVDPDDPNNIPGRKFGEEYVALRESNIPIHAHSETLLGQPDSQNQEWAAIAKGGSQQRLINTPTLDDDSRRTLGVVDVAMNYQMSPLEYPTKEENQITIPHDNLPPYMKMYIWECTEITDEERAITEENKNGDNKCVVTWLPNGGKWTTTGSGESES